MDKIYLLYSEKPGDASIEEKKQYPGLVAVQAANNMEARLLYGLLFEGLDLHVHVLDEITSLEDLDAFEAKHQDRHPMTYFKIQLRKLPDGTPIVNSCYDWMNPSEDTKKNWKKNDFFHCLVGEPCHVFFFTKTNYTSKEIKELTREISYVYSAGSYVTIPVARKGSGYPITAIADAINAVPLLLHPIAVVDAGLSFAEIWGLLMGYDLVDKFLIHYNNELHELVYTKNGNVSYRKIEPCYHVLEKPKNSIFTNRPILPKKEES